MPGFSGEFCQACPIGTYKYGYSFGICLPCINAPDESYYTTLAWDNANCPYECNEGFEPYDVNPDCLNGLEL